MRIVLLVEGNTEREKVLLVSANACPELKAFLNTILRLCGGEALA